MFIDRIQEMRTLREQYASPGASLVVIYGRRRTGKTTLIQEFLKEKKGFYFLATKESEKQNLAEFRKEAAAYLENELLGMSNADWSTCLKELAKAHNEEKQIIVIDEFQYIGQSNGAFPSVLQKIWDTVLAKENVMLILCGSLIISMRNQLLDYDSPLYGRRTAQIRMKQIPFAYYKDFKTGDERSLIEQYAVTGGVPKYIESFRADSDIYEGIRRNILNQQSYLYEEPQFLLMHEVSEIGSYFSLIRAIANNNHKLSEISAFLQIPQSGITKYLQQLTELDIIERRVPATELQPEKSKSGLYYIKDNFLAFWFQFIYPYRSFIERGETDIVLKKIKEGFIQNHVSYVYEDICREKVRDLAASGDLNFVPTHVGSYWGREVGETDIVAFTPGEKTLLLGECKYTESQKGMEVLHKLQSKAEKLMKLTKTEKPVYIIFSTGGFSQGLLEEADRGGVILISSVL